MSRLRKTYNLVGAILIALLAIALIVGGVQLMALSGSPYYLVAGLALLPVAWLVFTSNANGTTLLLFWAVATAIWAIWESGGIGWGLVPRLSLPGLLLILTLLPATASAAFRARRTAAAFALVGMAVLMGSSGLATSQDNEEIAPVEVAHERSGLGDWRFVGGDPGGSKYSVARQINRGNVASLKRAWTYEFAGNRHIGKGGLQATPIQVGSTLYVCSGQNDIVALDSDTGRELWKFQANSNTTGVMSAGCRGVAYFRVPESRLPCSERIITSTVDARLLAVDAKTGKACADFGDGGAVSLARGMGLTSPGYYFTTSAPTIGDGKIIVGGWVTDNQFWGEPSGAIRAFDAVTGAFAWAFDPGNPDRNGEPQAGETYALSTPNAWGPMSVDEDAKLVYAPLGNPTPDYVGRHRRFFDEKFGSSVIALDLRTGALRWSFQTVHHDLWDYDVAAQPLLADVQIGGRPRKALVQLTKRGETFVLDRITGQPIVPVHERRMSSAGAVPGEPVSASQPFSALPSVRGPDLTESSMWGLTALDQLWCRIEFRKSRYSGIFTPPGLTQSINFPGFLGGTNWGGGSFDSATGRIVFNLSHVPVRVQLLPRAEADRRGIGPASPETAPSGTEFAQKGTPYAAVVRPFLSPLGIPCNEPPFGRIVSMDLNARKLAWDTVLGTTRDSGPFGMESHVPLRTGMPNTGGSIATAGRLVFIGAAQDRTFRAFDIDTGRMLWSHRLPAGGQAVPMTYISPKTGKQFVVIAAGGNRLIASKLGNSIVAFSLPD